MDQTDIAVTSGFVCSGAGAFILKDLTGWSGWIAYPLGGIATLIFVMILVYSLIGLIAKAGGHK